MIPRLLAIGLKLKYLMSGTAANAHHLIDFIAVPEALATRIKLDKRVRSDRVRGRCVALGL